MSILISYQEFYYRNVSAIFFTIYLSSLSVGTDKELMFSNGKVNKNNLINFVKNIKKYSGITDADAVKLAAFKLIDSTHHGAMWYRIGAVRHFTGGMQIQPVLDDHLKEVNFHKNKLLSYFWSE